MLNKRHKREEIVAKLRQVDGLAGQGKVRINVIGDVRVTERACCRWRKKYGGMGYERLRLAVSDLTLDKLIPTEAAPGNF